MEKHITVITCNRCARELPSEPMAGSVAELLFDATGLVCMRLPDGWTRFVTRGEQTIVCDHCETTPDNEVRGFIEALGFDDPREPR